MLPSLIPAHELETIPNRQDCLHSSAPSTTNNCSQLPINTPAQNVLNSNIMPIPTRSVSLRDRQVSQVFP